MGASVRRVLLAGLLLLALAIGVGGGYFAGDYLDDPEPTASGTVGPLGEVSPSPTPSPTEPSLPVKTPVPSTLDPLRPGLDYNDRTFTVHPETDDSVQLSLLIPRAWTLTRDSDHPDEVKFLDKFEQRGVRVQALAPDAQQTPSDAMDDLVVALKKSQPPQNDLRILDQETETITGDDGEPRSIATLTYTYIPGKTRLYVLVRWIATQGDGADISMSVYGLDEDADALAEIVGKASASVNQPG
jgi:hypothetical protein